MLPEMHAFCRDLLRWFELVRRRRLRSGFRQEAKRILALRTEEVLANGRSLRIEVHEDYIAVAGVAIRDVEKRGDLELAQHLHSLQIRGITVQPVVSGTTFVQFLERCAEESPGPGTRRALRAAVPSGIRLDLSDHEPTAPVVAPPKVVEPVQEPVAEPTPPPPPASDPADLDPEVVEAVDAAIELLLAAEPGDTEAFREVLDLYGMIASQSLHQERDYTIRKVAESGEQLLRDRQMRTWLSFLRFLAVDVPRDRSLNGLQFSLEVLSMVGEPKQVATFFQYLGKEGASILEMLRDYLEIAPSGAVDTVASYAVCCPALSFDSGGPERRMLLDYVVASNDNLAGLQAIASHPDANLARLAIEAMPSLRPDSGASVIGRALEHPTVAIRYDAARAAQCLPVSQQAQCLPPALHDVDEAVRKQAAWSLSKCCVPRAIRPVLAEVSKPEFAQKSVEEQVLFYKALASTARPEALYAIERRLAQQRPRLKDRLARSLFGQVNEDAVREKILQALEEMDTPQVEEIVRRARSS